MWQPNRRQWPIIWTVALLLVLGWPIGGSSLGVKAVNWAADPRGTLPPVPAPIPFGLGDDGDAVAQHDAAEREYYRMWDEGGVSRLRLRLKGTSDPLEPATQRQVVIAVAVLAGLWIWRQEAQRSEARGQRPGR
jgi:hypothetical protein